MEALGRPGMRCPPPTRTSRRALQVGALHEQRHSFVTGMDPIPERQLGMYPPIAIDAAEVGMHVTDQISEHRQLRLELADPFAAATSSARSPVAKPASRQVNAVPTALATNGAKAEPK